MKKDETISRLLKLCLIIVSLTVLFAISTDQSAAATIEVGPSQTYTTINQGIAAANAYDEIIVHNNPNNYTEQVNVNKNGLKIKAAPGEDVTVKPGLANGFQISGVSNITIDRFNIIGNSKSGGWGILAQAYSHNCTISNNFIGNINVGISYAGTNNTFINNYINNTATGMTLNNAVPGGLALGNFLISNNRVDNVNSGIVGTGLTNFQITNNNITTIDATGGIFGIDVTINSFLANQNNVISNNKITGANKANINTNGIRFQNSGSSTSFTSHNFQMYSNSITNYFRGVSILNYRPVGTAGVTNIYLNRIYDNTIGMSFQNSVVGAANSGLINAINNWWGKNTAPTVVQSATEPTTATDIWIKTGTGTPLLNYDPWIVLNINASPNSIKTGQTSAITADLTKNSNNQDTTLIYPGKYVPNGITANFSSDSKGSVNPTSNTSINGKANTTFTANTPGVSTVSATVDGQTVNTDVTIQGPTVDLVVTKDVETFEPVWNYNDTQAFFITVSNYGPDDATLVKIEDVLPAGLIFDHAIVSAGVFDEATMTWYLGDLLNGGFETLELFVNVTGHNTIVNNTVNATSDETELNPGDNIASVLVAIPAAAHVNLTKEYINLLGNVITSSNYQQNFWGLIKANNIGPDSTNVILEDVLNTFPFIQFATDQFGENFYVSYNNGTNWIPGSTSGINFQDLTAFGNFFITNMQSGDNIWLKVFLTTDFATGMVNNEVTAYTSAYEYLTPGFASADLTVPPAADLSVTKWDDADYIGQPANYLDFVHYYIQIDNLGPDDATGVILNDLIPAGLIIDPFSILASQGTFDPLTGIWTVTDGLSPTLGYGNSAFLSFLAQVVSTGAITNTVDVNAATYDQDMSNNHATDTINVPLASTSVTVDPVSGFKGDLVNLKATLTDTHNNVPIPGKSVQFSVNGNVVGTATTNAQGIATLAYTITQNPGTYTILAQFFEDTIYAESSNTNTLTINHTPTAIVVDPISGSKGDLVDLKATLTDTHNNVPIPGKSVQFSVNGNVVGTATTNAQGIATLAYTITQNPGTYTILAEFFEDTLYAGSSNTNDLTVGLIPTSIVVDSVSGFKGDLVDLTATLTDTLNNVPLAGKSVQFSVNGNVVGTAVTNAQGIATLAYTITQNIGTYTILAQFFEDTVYAGSSNTNDLTVNPTATAIIVNPATGFNGHVVNLVATLTDTLNNVPLAGKSVQFSVNGNVVGTAVTNAQGIATFAYTITQNIGTYTILAQFFQDTVYAASSNTNNLNVVTFSPPVVTSSDPVYNGMNVAVNKVIKVYFNEAVKFGTNPWIELLTSTGTPVPFTRTISGGNVLSIASTSLFASNTMYRVILHSNSITDLDGAGLVGPWSTIFTTSPAPTVTSSNPTYNAMNVAVDKVIKVYFSQSVKFGTNPWIEFTTSTGTPIPFTRTISGGNVLSIKTTPLMATNTTYRITLHTNSITNLAGAGIALWSTIFTTTT